MTFAFSLSPFAMVTNIWTSASLNKSLPKVIMTLSNSLMLIVPSKLASKIENAFSGLPIFYFKHS